jgi:PAS domain S-box-containing protein
MTVLLISGLFLVILIWVARGYLLHRDVLLRNVMLVFASVGMLFVLGLIRVLLGRPPDLVAGFFAAVLLGQPFFTLRLVSKLRPVPGWVIGTAAVGWALSAVPVVLVKRPLPPAVVWPVVTTFFVVEILAAWLLAVEGRRRGGAARIRLCCAAAGTALFGVCLLVAGGGPALSAAARAIAVVSALTYLLAFAPPRRVRGVWSRGAAYALMRQLLTAPVDEPPQQTWRRYCEGACDVLGADGVTVLLATTPGTVEPVAQAGLAALGEQRFDDDDIDLLLATSATIDACAGRTGLPKVAAELARASGARFVTAAPLAVPGRRGALVLLNRYRTLFADDDAALFTELAAQAATLAERAAVLQERQRLAVIVESSHDAIIGKTLDGVITSWNVGAERLYGYRAAEAIGRPAGMLSPPDRQELEAQLMARISRGERIEQYQVRHRRKDGAMVTVSLTLSPITDPGGPVVGVACISRDIGERQRAEAMFRGLLEAAPDAIIGVTADGLIALTNAQAERLFGYPRDELLGQPVELLIPQRARAAHPRHRDGYFAHPHARPMAAGTPLAAVRKDGTEFPAEISLSALETDQGVIVSAAVRDVSERLEAQAERERLAAQAERDAADRRLQHTRRLESLGQLAGGVAHDFNNILGVIASYTELSLEVLDGAAPSPPELAGVRADLAQISRAAERATQLTKQLLAFGRRDITQAEVLSLNKVIGDVEQMLRRALGEHISLITHLDPELWPVHADPGHIEQILLNLAVNARDAMPTGGTLSIDTTNTDLDHTDTAADPNLTSGGYVRVRVSDTGSGMPPEVLERAFEPFYTTKPQGAGTGLGLATVYGIAAAAGGHVRLYSEPDIGTTVTLLFPANHSGATEATATAGRPGVDAPAGPRPHETILLVEDEDALREVATRILTRAGYQVLAAEHGAAAIRLAETHPTPIDLLLTDVIMPKMLGNEVAARIHAVHPELPVLYMSGYAQPVLTENGNLQAGITIVEKPFTSRHLLDQIDTVLHRGPAATPERDQLGVPNGSATAVSGHAGPG